MAAADVEMAASAPEQPSTSSQEEEDLYIKLKTLQRTLEFLDIQVRTTFPDVMALATRFSSSALSARAVGCLGEVSLT